MADPSTTPDEREPRRPGETPPDKAKAEERLPPAGPHDEKELTDDRRTPGAGTLPPEEPNDTVDAPTG